MVVFQVDLMPTKLPYDRVLVNSIIDKLDWRDFSSDDDDSSLYNISFWWVISVYSSLNSYNSCFRITAPFVSNKYNMDLRWVRCDNNLLVLGNNPIPGSSDFLVEAIFGTCYGTGLNMHGSTQIIWVRDDKFCVPVNDEPGIIKKDIYCPLLYPSKRILGDIKDKLLEMTL